jgi:ATP-dependent Lon protease
MGIDTIIIPWQNKKDLAEIPEEYKKKVTFVPVKTVAEVLEIALHGYKKKSNKKSKSVQTRQMAA